MASCPEKSRFYNISKLFTKVLAFFFDCGNNSRISMLFEIQDKSKGCSMSNKASPFSVVVSTSRTLLASDKVHSFGNILIRFTAAPTVANTSVSRQTGLTGIWKKSFDQTSLTPHPQCGVASTMRTNTLVVSPTNSRVALFLFSALTSVIRPSYPNYSLAKVSI